MLTNLFIRLGWSRDDWKWLWLQVVMVAGLVASNVFDVPYWFGYLGIPLSVKALHWILSIAALLVWLAGKYDSSPLPSSRAMASGAVPGAPTSVTKIGAVLLACVLGAGWLSACAHPPPHLTPRVVSEFYGTQVIHNLDVIRDFADSATRTTPPVLTVTTMLKVIDWHQALVTAIHAAPGGWRPTALAGLDQLRALLPVAEYAKLKPFIDGARLTVQEVP